MPGFTFRFERKARQGAGLYYDPLYGYVPLPHYIFQALDLESFQRMRYIKLTFRSSECALLSEFPGGRVGAPVVTAGYW